MNVASLELTKQLYELSGWEPLDYAVVERAAYGHPRYPLGYLLRKLPQKLDGPINYWFQLSVGHGGEWFAWYDGTKHQKYADTPEDAACQLAIELFKQGVLKREDA